MRCAPILLTVAFSLTAYCAFSTAPAAAEDFRIDTEMFVGSEKEPSVETLTIFANGQIYDFLLTKPAEFNEFTVFEPRRGILTLLDVKRQVRASMTTQELLDAAVTLQTAAIQSSNPVFAAAAQPSFQTQTEDMTTKGGSVFKQLTFTDKLIHYTVHAETARQPGAARDYKYFADWYARLNSVRTGNLPAGARLEVNDALAKQGLIPTRVERVIQVNPLRKLEMRTQHLVNWTLSNEDRRRIDEVGNHLASAQIRLVTFDEYCRPATK